MKLTHILPHYRIAIVGSGAVGSYYGVRLAHMGRDVHFLMRSDFDTVKRRGIKVRSKQGNFHLQGVKAYREAREIGTCDLVIVAVKSTANEDLLDILPPLLGARTMILTLQNGIGPDEFLAAQFGADRVLGGLCYICVSRTAPGQVEHFAEGRIVLGEFSGFAQARTHDVASEFKRCGVTCTVVGDLAAQRWKKLVWNIPFNGLSIAAGGLDTSRLLAAPSLRTLVQEIMREVIGAAGAVGHPLPATLAEDLVQRTRGMGAYRPSSLIDFEAGREVEVEEIWGEPYRRAFNAGASVPRIEMLYQLIKHALAARNPVK